MMQDKEQTTAQRTRRFVLSNIQILLIPVLIFGGMLVLDFRQRVIDGQQKVAEQEALETEIAALEAEQRRLQAAKAYYSSDAYVEAWAHSEGKMVRPGEVLIVPLAPPQEEAAVEVPGPITVAELPTHDDTAPWQVWWALFFDAAPPFSQ